MNHPVYHPLSSIDMIKLLVIKDFQIYQKQLAAFVAGMLLALSLSVAVVVAIDLSIDSARSAFSDARRALSGSATHQIVSDGAPVPDSLLAQLRREGVRASAPVIDLEAAVSASKTRTSAIRGGAYMSRYFWPMKLVSASKEKTSAIRGTWLFSSMFGLPAISSYRGGAAERQKSSRHRPRLTGTVIAAPVLLASSARYSARHNGQ